MRRRDALMLSLRSLATVDEIRSAREGIEQVVADEQTRLAGVEERLRGLVSLAAVAAAVTVGIGVAQLRGELGGHLAGSSLALASVYAVVQLLAALLAAIKGLERRSFRAFQPEDLISGWKEEEKARELRLAEITFDRMIDVQEAGNRKVEQMSVAYKALKNFVIALLFAAAVVLVAQIATERASPEPGSAAGPVKTDCQAHLRLSPLRRGQPEALKRLGVVQGVPARNLAYGGHGLVVDLGTPRRSDCRLSQI